jgi:hypothetical protein
MARGRDPSKRRGSAGSSSSCRAGPSASASTPASTLTGRDHYLKETVGTRREAERLRTRLLSQVDENRSPHPRDREPAPGPLPRRRRAGTHHPAALRRQDRQARPAHDRRPAGRPARRRDPGAALRPATSRMLRPLSRTNRAGRGGLGRQRRRAVCQASTRRLWMLARSGRSPRWLPLATIGSARSSDRRS